MKIIKYFLFFNSFAYFIGLLWGSSSMDNYTLYGNISIAIISLLVAIFPKENVRETSSYIVFIGFVVSGIVAAVALLIEDFSRKYGVSYDVVVFRFTFIFVLVYCSYQYWSFRKGFNK